MRLPACFAVLLASAAAAQPLSPDYHGTWHGPMLFHMAGATAAPRQAPAVHDATLEIATDGSVRGRVAGAGCRLAGSAADYVSTANATLELSFTDCHDARFNGRFAGRLIGNPALGYASLRLAYTSSAESDTAQVSAILRR